MISAMRIGVAGAAMALAVPAFSCSICRCGDPTFNALGKEGVAQQGLRLALDWDQLEKTQGGAEERESMRERRSSLLAAYGINQSLGVFARLPYSQRTLSEEGERTKADGFADPEIYAQLRLWSSAFDGAVGTRAALYAVGGVKPAWGANDLARDGERLDEHAQPGTGSTDWFAGVSGSYQLDPRSALFVSTQYRRTGRNDAGYHYGDVALLNFAYERKLDGRWDGVLEVNYRHAERDQLDAGGAVDEDTGGAMVFLTPRLLFDAGGGWVLRASVQLPLTQSGLNGAQHEKAVYNLGITRLLNSGR